jgi:hypothetical protein
MNNVSRRGFLGALAAFTAAVASGKTMPPSIAGGSPTPEQGGIMATLKDCRVRGYSNSFNWLEPSCFEVEYVYAPGVPETELDRYVVERIKGLRPVAIRDSRVGRRVCEIRFM